MLLLLLISLATPSQSQLMYYYLYPSYGYPQSPALTYQQSPAYGSQQQQYICGSPPNYQYQATPCTAANYNPLCETECQSTPYCQRFDSASSCVNGCCNSTLSNPNPSSPAYNNPAPNTNGIARDNGITDITCPFNDPSAGSCVDGNCPTGFICNLDNVCCPCSVGAAQGACSAGGCSSSALRCETATGMCCPRPLNGSASATGASGGYAQLQYTQGLNGQQQQQFPQQQQGSQFQQQPSNQPYNGQQQQQRFGNQQQFPPQQQQSNNFNAQSQNQFQQSSSSQNPTTPFVYNTQNPNASPSTALPQGSTTTVPTIYPSSG
ncbi:hpo-26 [Pristionchus pacificus]|uniref:Hpo-26 n=1 Tax=Pristionchus pacificus TaxID=54126 RepID=A0A2A6BIA9_PRIPA|nr:hpo-26 [Pristionchus pacificus]|eukprot:PDM65568.1 hpo-26 [Pristionchus pacificus]